MAMFKIDDEAAQEEIKQKFLEVNALYGKTKIQWLACQENLKGMAVNVSDLLKKYHDFVNQKGVKIAWNLDITRCDREALQRSLEQ